MSFSAVYTSIIGNPVRRTHCFMTIDRNTTNSWRIGLLFEVKSSKSGDLQ
jgi:hypothetical protein